MRAAVALLALAGVAAHAQSALEEVIVTAQKRAEDQQDVPIAITALDAEALEEQRIERLDEVTQRVPNVAYSTFSSGRPEYTVRGIGTATLARSALENSVIVFVDEVYVSRSAASEFDLFDLEQISVLRGPQGTLFGKNVVGGAISITTARPNFDAFEARLHAGVGNFDATDLKGLLSGPLGDNVAGKLSFAKRDRNGFGVDLLSGAEADDLDTLGARGQLAVRLSPTADLLLSADYNSSADGSQTRSVLPAFDAFPPSASSFLPRRSEHGMAIGTATRGQGLAATLNWRRERGTLTGIAAWRDVDFHTVDQFGPRGIAVGQGYEDRFGQDETASQLTLEVRYASDLDGAFNGVAGAFFIAEEVDRHEFEHIVLNDDGVLNGSRGDWNGQAETKGWAAFFDGSVAFHERLTARAGVRYTRDAKTNRTVGTLADDDVPGTPWQIIFENYDVTGEATFSDVTPRLVLETRVLPGRDALFYVSAAKGFKSGGFDSKVAYGVEADKPIAPEQATNLEVGFKSRWLGDSLQVNLAAFRTDFKDLQLVTLLFDETTNAFQGLRVKNAARASIEGGEVELAWLVAADLQVTFGYGYLDARFDEFLVGVVGGFEIRRDGYRMPNAPRNSCNASAAYAIGLARGAKLRAVVDYAWRDAVYFGSDSNDDVVETRQESYGVLNGSLAWQTADERWLVSLWSKNLTDELYADKRMTFAGSAWAHYTAPRTYGLSVTWRR